ncbi:MAG: T9SS type A sorting domain-containing protein [Bacteroidetes bacterium]|nr:T9SS type A sorting domain-containing protein [Bacteroidota bacterium]
MRIKFKLFLFMLSAQIYFAQVVITTPQFPTETDSIIVTFNASEAQNKSLIGYTGTLYAHTGVTTRINGGSETKWQHVIESWGNNNTQPSLTRIGTNLYQLVINNPRNYYKLTNANEKITELSFVFRSADASKQSEDIFIEIFEEGIKLKIIEPAELPIYPEAGEKINFKAASDNADSISLFLNNQFITSTLNDTISYEITAAGNGRQWIKFTVYSQGQSASDSTHFYVRGPVKVESLPSGTSAGINYVDNSTVTLALFAPDKDFVYLIGDFNNWRFDPDINPDTDEEWLFDPVYYLNITPDSTTYWTTITGLTPKHEYRFQYLVDGTLRIADPYADKILEAEDSLISETTYAGLIPYPINETNFSVSVFQTAQQPYIWQAEGYVKPEKTNLIIYELLIRDFVSTHDYKTLIDTLDYLENLGVNAIELMPVNEFEGNESWGYNTSFYFAPDKYYGSKNDLKKFIDECHKRGIAVIMDIVLNHMYGRSSFVRLYSSGDYGPPSSGNPWFNVTSPNQTFSFGYDLNHESQYTKELVDRVNRYWLEEYKFDGYRFDFTKGFTQRPGDGGSYDQSRIAILKRMADKIWEYDSTAYVILEHFAPDSEEKELTDYGMMTWGNNNHNYLEASMGYISNSNFSRISYKNHSFTKPNSVGYMESHDEERMMYKNLQFGNSSGNYSIKNLLNALQRVKLAGAFFFTVPGPKMIWQFGELGYDYSIDYNGRVGNKPIRWDYYEHPARHKVYQVFSELIKLRKENEVFNTSDFVLSLAGSVKRIELKHESMDLIVLGNFDVVNRTSSPSFTKKGMWYNYFSGDSINVTDTLMSVDLSPADFHIYTTKKLSVPAEDILTGVEEINSLPDIYELHQNYPNPFNPTTAISFTIPNVADATHPGGQDFASTTLKIYDILGREVTVLVNDNLHAGRYTINFNAAGLSSGIYFYKLTSGSFSVTRKMMLLK